MLYFRADANSKIGSGHIMRCLAIANAAKEQGIESTFITADEESKQMIELFEYPIICLDSTWFSLDNEINKLLELIDKLQIKELFIDSYYVTKEYLNSIKKYIKIIYLDDNFNAIYPVDVLINYNIYANNFNYAESYRNTQLLLGCEFAPLRMEFQNINYVIRNEVKNILITTGGSDYYNVAGNLLRLFNKQSQYRTLNFHVVAGSYNKNFEELKELSKSNSNIMLYSNVRKMSELMKKCDIAISAGGSTLYELCACGIPSISFSFVDNQLDAVKEFNRQNIIYYAGDLRDGTDICLNNLSANMEQLILNKNLRKEQSLCMRKVVDGYGAGRIMKMLQKKSGGIIC